MKTFKSYADPLICLVSAGQTSECKPTILVSASSAINLLQQVAGSYLHILTFFFDNSPNSIYNSSIIVGLIYIATHSGKSTFHDVDFNAF